MSVCKECNIENELDTWYEVPRLEHLVCPRCAGDYGYARPITIDQMAERTVDLNTQLKKLVKENQELKQLNTESPDIAKQLRRLTREAERMRQANERVAAMLTELTNNLSPRWVFSAREQDMGKVKEVMTRLAEEAGPGAILRMSEEEMSILQSVVRL